MNTFNRHATSTSQIELIGICGASGAGKSTLALGLQEMFPHDTAVVHFDDFQKSNELITAELGSIKNWDDPRVTDFDMAYNALRDLKENRPITVQVKNEFDNPGFYHNVFVRFPKTIEPKRLTLVEGHYTLYDSRIRNLFSLTLFLENDISVSMKRRTKRTDDNYNQTYVLPMFKRYVEPTGRFADRIIDVNQKNPVDVAEFVGALLAKRYL